MRTLKYLILTLVLGIIFQPVFSGYKNIFGMPIHPVTATDTAGTGTLKLGTYKIYSGIPSMYIWHFELKAGGNYVVALSSDEDSYATGTYTYHPDTNTIEWKTGFFWQKKWGGKVSKPSGNTTHIEFNRATYADSQ